MLLALLQKDQTTDVAYNLSKCIEDKEFLSAMSLSLLHKVFRQERQKNAGHRLGNLFFYAFVAPFFRITAKYS